jgi:hypothetical protein
MYSFPMGFVSDRLYAGISRREFSEPSDPGCFWTVSKVVHTPATAAWAALNYPGADGVCLPSQSGMLLLCVYTGTSSPLGTEYAQQARHGCA